MTYIVEWDSHLVKLVRSIPSAECATDHVEMRQKFRSSRYQRRRYPQRELRTAGQSVIDDAFTAVTARDAIDDR